MKSILKISIREIWQSKKRFISIVLIVLLGVGFYCGIKSTSPDMKDNINNYVYEKNMYDLEIISTQGLTISDIDAIKNLKNIKEVEGSISFDAYVNINDEQKVFRIYEISNNINKLTLKKGHLPENENEIVLEERFFKSNNFKIGDTLVINSDNDNVKLNYNEVKIVGYVSSPLRISNTSNSTSLGNGTIDYYMFMNESNIKSDFYTEIYITINNDKNYKTYDKNYKELVEDINSEIEPIKSERITIRYNEIKNDALKSIEKSEETLKNEKIKFNKEVTNAKTKISNAKEELKNYETKLNDLKVTRDNYNEIIELAEQNNNSISLINSQLLNESLTEEEITNLNTSLYKLNYANEILNQNKLLIESTLLKENVDINNIDSVIESYEEKIDNGYAEISKNEASLNKEISIASAKFKDAEVKINEAKETVNDITKGKWYILDKLDNMGYSNYLDDTSRLEKIGAIFPTVFFVVAALVCLTSMTRMVDEERIIIGTLKSLGYNKFSIAFKYIMYAFLAAIIGSVFGMIIGFNTLPLIIGNIYNMMYDIPTLKCEFIWYYALIGLLVCLVSTVGATIYSCMKSLNERPANLLRQKSPAAGKRILLERIKFIWSRLSFTTKVTYRNLFRYKKRLLMTIIGITGCTSLIVAGFGLSDSITSIISLQYSDIFKYDMMVSIKDDYEYINEKILSYDSTTSTLGFRMETVDVTNIENNQTIYLSVPNDTDNISDYISFESGGKKLFLEDNTVIITNKLSKLLNVSAGDTLVLKDSNDTSVEVTISTITDNYIMHYIYMTKNEYENLFNKEYEINTIDVISTAASEELESLSSDLLNYSSNVLSINILENSKQIFSEIMDNMKMVAYILVVSAGLLAFVVLFNLTNVNISERQRELATIKVLGFYDKEVYKYIIREINILTFMGIPLGLIGGYILTTFVVKTCELDMLTFKTVINPISYIYGVLLTVLFAFIVNIITYFTLKKINMIESLKSME